MLERENKREKTLESTAREKKFKAAQKRPNSGAVKPTGEALAELIARSEEEFYASVEEDKNERDN